jgi:hypothetical protein
MDVERINISEQPLLKVNAHRLAWYQHGGTNTLPAHGLEEVFSSCAVVSDFGSGGK